MYTIYVKFTCLPERRAAFIERVKAEGVLEAIRAEDGCIRYARTGKIFRFLVGHSVLR